VSTPRRLLCEIPILPLFEGTEVRRHAEGAVGSREAGDEVEGGEDAEGEIAGVGVGGVIMQREG
jgi:hypothetical protein